MAFIEAIEQALNRKAQKNFLPLQMGDVPATWANVDDLAADLNYAPTVSIQEGVKRFVDWYLDFFEVNE